MRALLEEARRLDEAEIDARLGAIQYVLDCGSFGNTSLYRLMPVDDIQSSGLRDIQFSLGFPSRLDLIGMGRRLRRKILEILREILCSGDFVWRGARLAIEVAIEAGAPGAIEATATVLASIGIAPAIAVLVAAWIGRMLLEELFELSCKGLSDYLKTLAAT